MAAWLERGGNAEALGELAGSACADGTSDKYRGHPRGCVLKSQ